MNTEMPAHHLQGFLNSCRDKIIEAIRKDGGGSLTVVR